MKRIKPFRVMTGLGRAYVVNIKTREVLVSFPLVDETDEPSEQPADDNRPTRFIKAKDLCDSLNERSYNEL